MLLSLIHISDKVEEVIALIKAYQPDLVMNIALPYQDLTIICLLYTSVHPGSVRQIINLTQTTSGSYLLMSSLDISRRNLALRARQASTTCGSISTRSMRSTRS